jgi:hypothetical protein
VSVIVGAAGLIIFGKVRLLLQLLRSERNTRSRGGSVLRGLQCREPTKELAHD